MRKLADSLHAVVDLNVVIVIGIAFAGLMVLGYVFYIIREDVLDSRPGYTAANNLTNLRINGTVSNLTTGWDSAINLLVIAITIFILALAIGALLMLRGRNK